MLESNARFGVTPNAFIFFLNDFEGLEPFASKVKKDNIKFAIDKSSVDGPKFGVDLFIFFNPGKLSYTDFGNYYSVPASVVTKLTNLGLHQRTFSPDEVEVFYLHPSR